MKQKFLIAFLSLAFVFTASAAYANLSFSTDTITGSNKIILDSNNVGIGTSNPFGLLSIEGDMTGSKEGLTLYPNIANGFTDSIAFPFDLEASTDAAFSGNLSAFYGAYIFLNHQGSGDVTNLSNIYIDTAQNSGSGSIQNVNGLYVAEQTAGTTNYNIFSAGASSNNRFEGKLTVGPDESSLTPSWLNGYTNANNIITNNAPNKAALGIEDAAGFGLYVISTGAGPYGVEADAISTESGFAAYSYVADAEADGAGVILNDVGGLWVANISAANGAVITNAYGLKVSDINAGTNNYAIKTGLGKVQLGDTLQQFKGSNIASAGTIALTGGNVFHITGTSSISTINTCDSNNSGRFVTFIFDSTAGVLDGSNLKLNGSFSATADDTISLVCDGSSWYETARSVN